MSTSPETRKRPARADDRLVTLLSQWLARHVDDEELRRGVEAIGTHDLSAGQAEAVHELLTELGGHYVQGHVDGVGRVTAATPEGEGRRLTIEPPPELLRYCVEKGSVTVNGVSLTIAALDGSAFDVAVVPHTLAATTLGRIRPGDEVNLEADVLAKYVERLLPAG